MEAWLPQDPHFLVFDFNQCTDQEMCEVFRIEPAIARRLYGYRLKTVHVFDLRDLLQLEGVSDDLIQNWFHPPVPDAADFNRKLQEYFGMQTERPEPIPSLMGRVCTVTGATGCMLIARNGNMLIEIGGEIPTLRLLAQEIPVLVQSVHENLLEMNLDVTYFQVVSFNQYDVLCLPASGFYLVSLQEVDSLDSAKLALWLLVAKEIRHRYPPTFYFDHQAQLTNNDIAFDCPSCNLQIIVDRTGSGYTFPCPRCKNPVTVPGESILSNHSPKNAVESSASIETASN